MLATSILAGDFKGTRLETGRGQHIRPTSARVRESIFDILSNLVLGDVLDLYAGAGTLGFEALSRGASSVTFVDNDARAVQLLKVNRSLFPEDRIVIAEQECLDFLERTCSDYDIILADPPYGKADLPSLRAAAMAHLRHSGALAIESSVRENWVDPDARIRRYGDTQISIFRP